MLLHYRLSWKKMEYQQHIRFFSNKFRILMIDIDLVWLLVLIFVPLIKCFFLALSIQMYWCRRLLPHVYMTFNITWWSCVQCFNLSFCHLVVDSLIINKKIDLLSTFNLNIVYSKEISLFHEIIEGFSLWIFNFFERC